MIEDTLEEKDIIFVFVFLNTGLIEDTLEEKQM